MGKGGPLAFLNKKPWHPANLRNLEEVWKRENQKKEDDKKLIEIQKQYQEERDKEQLEQVAQQAGLRKKIDRVDWMYQGQLFSQENVKKQENQKQEQDDQEKELQEQLTQQLLKEQQEKQNLPSFYKSSSAQAQNENWHRLHNDPLFMIMKRQQEGIKKITSNPVRMEQIRNELFNKDINSKSSLQQPKKEKQSKKKKKNKKEKEKQRENHKQPLMQQNSLSSLEQGLVKDTKFKNVSPQEAHASPSESDQTHLNQQHIREFIENSMQGSAGQGIDSRSKGKHTKQSNDDVYTKEERRRDNERQGVHKSYSCKSDRYNSNNDESDNQQTNYNIYNNNINNNEDDTSKSHSRKQNNHADSFYDNNGRYDKQESHNDILSYKQNNQLDSKYVYKDSDRYNNHHSDSKHKVKHRKDKHKKHDNINYKEDDSTKPRNEDNSTFRQQDENRSTRVDDMKNCLSSKGDDGSMKRRREADVPTGEVAKSISNSSKKIKDAKYGLKQRDDISIHDRSLKELENKQRLKLAADEYELKKQEEESNRYMKTNYKPGKLSKEEREKRLQEMTNNANVHEGLKHDRVKHSLHSSSNNPIEGEKYDKYRVTQDIYNLNKLKGGMLNENLNRRKQLSQID